MRSKLVTRAELAQVPRWTQAFADQRKDHRYYEIVEDTIRGFDYRCIVVADAGGTVRAVQPCFVLDQDLLQRAGQAIGAFAARVRRYWPRFMYRRARLEHDPEKACPGRDLGWVPVFGKDHAPTI